MPAESPRILVVDDELEIREMLDLNLRLRGFTVMTARDGAEAVSVARDWRPDLIILDVMMPKVDGFTALRGLRRVTDVPIIMLSARSDVQDRVRGLEDGADEYLTKPFEVPELVARIRTRLRRSA